MATAPTFTITSLGRFTEIPREAFSPEQSAVANAFTGRRGTVPAPFRIFLSSAPLASRLMALSDHVLRNGLLSQVEVEIAVLAAARKLDAKFVQAAHRKIAANAGIPVPAIEAILGGKDPDFSDARQRAVYRCAIVMLNGRQEDAAFGEVTSVLGNDGVVEVAAILGFYGTCAYTLAFYEVPLPESSQPSSLTDAGQTLPVTVLTGFLGSGKTTLLGKLLLQPEMAGTAVIVNEFGEVGLDDLLVQQQEKPVLLKNGCLCCTVRGDLAITLQDLLLRRVQEGYAFQRVMIETTGLADPAPIIHTLMTDPGIAGRYRLEGIVTAIDCVNGVGTLERHPEATKQAAVADRLLLTKQDIARSGDVAQLRERLRALNAGAILIDATQGEVAAGDVLGLGLYDPRTKRIDVEKWLRAEAYAEAHDHAGCAIDGCSEPSHRHHEAQGRHGVQIRSCCLIRKQPVAWNDFSTWMERLVERKSAELLRVKGIVNILECPGEPLVIHGVQHIFHPPVRMGAWPSSDERTRIVLIARDWDESEIAAEFAELP